MKNNIGKQLIKNKNLLAFMADAPVVEEEGFPERVLDAMELSPTLGLTIENDKKKLLSLFFVIEADKDYDIWVSVSNSKGKRELKNLECSLHFETRGSVSIRVKGKMS